MMEFLSLELGNKGTLILSHNADIAAYSSGGSASLLTHHTVTLDRPSRLSTRWRLHRMSDHKELLLFGKHSEEHDIPSGSLVSPRALLASR